MERVWADSYGRVTWLTDKRDLGRRRDGQTEVDIVAIRAKVK
jgi:hypothetical protein